MAQQQFQWDQLERTSYNSADLVVNAKMQREKQDNYYQHLASYKPKKSMDRNLTSLDLTSTDGEKFLIPFLEKFVI